MTLKCYEEHVLLHINPFIGAKKLSELTAPVVSAFADRLREEGRSAEMIRRAIRSLGVPSSRKPAAAALPLTTRPTISTWTFPSGMTLAL